VLLNPAGIEPPVANEVYTAPPGPGHPLDIRSVADFDRVLAMNFVNIPHIPWWLKRDLVRLAACHASTYSTIMQALEPLLRNGLADKLSHITQPVLLVWGKQDGVIDPSAAALWAQGLPCVDMMLLEGCGHVPWIDARMQTLAAVGNFVDMHVAST
jgi:pimeloyl-ACP methyl ester carboxylesterase